MQQGQFLDASIYCGFIAVLEFAFIRFSNLRFEGFFVVPNSPHRNLRATVLLAA